MSLKKVVTYFMFIALLSIGTINNVSAQSTSYSDIEVHANIERYPVALVSDAYYKYVINQVTASKGSAKIHSYVGVYYDNGFHNIGKENSVNADGYQSTSVWYSSENNNFKNATTKKVCDGPRTSSNFCTQQGLGYRLYLKNSNVLFGFTVSGNFILTDSNSI